MQTSNTTFDVHCQRMQALVRANEIRIGRAAARRSLKHSAPRTAAGHAKEILLDPPLWAQGMTTERLLSAIRGFGPVRVRRIAGEATWMAIGHISDKARATIAMRCVTESSHLSGVRNGGPTNVGQAQQALQEANRVRLARADALAHIAKAPSRSLAALRAAALIGNPDRDPLFDGLPVRKALEAIPRVDHTTTNRLLDDLKMGRRATLGALSPFRARQLACECRTRFQARASSKAADCPRSLTRNTHARSN